MPARLGVSGLPSTVVGAGKGTRLSVKMEQGFAQRKETGGRAAEERQAAVAGPLSGVRVLHCSTVFAGPFACQLLGDFGADVVKVEHPIGGTTSEDTDARRMECPCGGRSSGGTSGASGSTSQRPTARSSPPPRSEGRCPRREFSARDT